MSENVAARIGLTSAVSSILHQGPEESFDRLTRLAVIALRTEAAVLSLMSDGRLLIKSQVGMPEPWASDLDVPLPHAIFRHALATSKAFVAPDLTRHPLTRDMLLGDEWEHAAYCGIPLVLADRKVVGVLSVLNRESREWVAHEIAFLEDLARSAVEAIEERVEPAPVPAQPAPLPPPAPAPSIDALAPATDAMLALDADWRVTGVNPRAETLLGLRSEDLLGRGLLDVFPSLPGSVFHAEYSRAFTDRAGTEIESWCGTLGRWLESRAWPARGGIMIQLRDVTARRETEEALRQSEARYRSVFQQSRDPIFFTAADGTVIECNRATLDVFGYSREELFRMRFDELFVEREAAATLRAAVEESGLGEGEARLRTKSGAVRDMRVGLASRLGTNGEKLGLQVTAQDQSEQVELEQERGRNAFHDPLTGLPNRAVFLDRLERLHMHAQRRPGYRFAVLFIDLDRFKPVNDTFGHIAGDELLTQVSRRLESCLRQEDSVARFGGDEFAVLLDNVIDIRDATLVAERINNELSLPIRIGPREIAASASIGIAISGDGHERAEQVLGDADAAMYRAKDNGGACYEVFDTEMHLKALEQLQLEGELRRAARDAEFEVHFQPIIGLESGAIGGFEALLRWRHPDRGLLHPVEFVHVAEQIGLTTDIGWFVLEQATRQMKEWLDLSTGPPLGMGVSLNLSPRQFRHPELMRRIEEMLADVGLNGSALRLEIGEDALMADTEYAADLLARLRDRGVTVTVDNFGTGFSSLRFLQRLPLAALKIDRTFLRGLDRDPYNRRVVGSVVALATNMGIDVISPGVETLEQLSEVRKLGVRFAQGYLFCEPLDADSATDLMLERVRA